MQTHELANYLVIFQSDRKLPASDDYYKMLDEFYNTRVEKIPGFLARESMLGNYKRFIESSL